MNKLLMAVILPSILFFSCSRDVAKEVITDRFLRYNESVEAAELVVSESYCRLGLDEKDIPVSAVKYFRGTPWEKYTFDTQGRISRQEFLPPIKNDTAYKEIKYRYDKEGRLLEAKYTFKKKGASTRQYLYDRYGLTEIRWLNARGITKNRTRLEYDFNDMTVTFASRDEKNSGKKTLYFKNQKSPHRLTLYDTTMILNLLPDEFQKRSIKSVKTMLNGKQTEINNPNNFTFQ